MAKSKRGFGILAAVRLVLSSGVLSLLQSVRSFARKLKISEHLRRVGQTRIKGLSLARNHKLVSTVVVIILVSALAVLLPYLLRPRRTTYYIAYVGRYQSTNGLDELNERILRKYIDELNTEMSGVKFELRTLSTRVDAKTNDSQREYEKIAKDPKYVLVIDNTWGEDLRSVATLIRDKRIPVISLNADKQGEDYRHQVVFMGYDDDVPRKLIAFHKQFLGSPQTSIPAQVNTAINALTNGTIPPTPTPPQTILIGERDFPSTYTFVNELPDIDALFVSGSRPTDDDRGKLFPMLEQKLRRSESGEQRRTLIINTHGYWGDEILNFINNNNLKRIDILGGPFITNKKLDEVRLKDDNRLILFTLRTDGATKGVRHELDRIASESPSLTKLLNVELFIERSLNAVSITRAGLFTGATQNTDISREGFIAYFQKRLISQAIVSNDELYRFDGDLLLEDKRMFEQYFNGQVSSYPWQLNSDNEPIPNVYIGMDDLNISAIDTKNRSFHANFIYWLKYEGPKIDVGNYVVFRNQSKVAVTPLPGNGDGRLFKASGDFLMNMDLEWYPLDKQEAWIEFDLTYPTEKARVSFDSDSFARKIQTDSAEEWILLRPYNTLDRLLLPSFTRPGGTDSKIDTGNSERRELLTIRTPMARVKWGAVVTIIMPLWMIGFTALCLLFIKDSSFSNIGGVCVLIFLTIIMFSITSAQIIPRANVVTVADKLFFGTFLAVFLVFLRVVILNSGSLPKNFQNWMKRRANRIGAGALLFYSIMMGLALTGWDVLLWNFFQE